MSQVFRSFITERRAGSTSIRDVVRARDAIDERQSVVLVIA